MSSSTVLSLPASLPTKCPHAAEPGTAAVPSKLFHHPQDRRTVSQSVSHTVFRDLCRPGRGISLLYSSPLPPARGRRSLLPRRRTGYYGRGATSNVAVINFWLPGTRRVDSGAARHGWHVNKKHRARRLRLLFNTVLPAARVFLALTRLLSLDSEMVVD